MKPHSYRRRKKLDNITDKADDSFEESHLSAPVDKTLHLGMVQEGTYVKWDKLAFLDLASVAKEPRKWVLCQPSPDANIRYSDSLESSAADEDQSGSEQRRRKSSVDDDDDIEDLTKSSLLSILKQEVRKEQEAKQELFEMMRLEAKRWSKSTFKLISLESRPGNHTGLIRLLFIVANRPFDDEKISDEEWTQLKPRTPYGTLPVVQRAGMTFGEPGAIIDVLSTSFDLMGVTNEEQLIVGAVYDRLRRLKNEHERPLSWLLEGNKEKSKIEWAQSQLTHVILPPAIKEWEEQIRKTAGPFIVASGMTLADLAIMDFMETCSNYILMENLLVDNLAVSDLLSAVKTNPRINLSRTKKQREEQNFAR